MNIEQKISMNIEQKIFHLITDDNESNRIIGTQLLESQSIDFEKLKQVWIDNVFDEPISYEKFFEALKEIFKVKKSQIQFLTLTEQRIPFMCSEPYLLAIILIDSRYENYTYHIKNNCGLNTPFYPTSDYIQNSKFAYKEILDNFYTQKNMIISGIKNYFHITFDKYINKK